MQYGSSGNKAAAVKPSEKIGNRTRMLLLGELPQMIQLS